MRIFIILILLSISTFSLFAASNIFYDLNGKGLSLEELVSSTKSVLFFWTTHCPYCIKEFVYLDENPKLIEGLNIYFINLGEDGLTVKAVLKRLRLKETITSRILLDPEALLADKFNIIGVPTYVFLVNSKVMGRSYYMNEEVLRDIFKQ
jgi:thiol-disulfide isomerase/thioredoxin